jgi:hypothetical protein
MSSQRIGSFAEFWPFYVSQHLNPICRRWHFVATTNAILCTAALLVTWKWWLVPLALVSSYGSAWIGHFVFEKNKPAAFTWPIWSLIADCRMFGKMITGTMDAEVRRVKSAQSPGAEPT